MGNRNDVTTDVFRAHASGIGSPDQGANRGPGDGDGLHAHLIDCFEHRDMSEATGAAATEREGKTLHAGGSFILRSEILAPRQCYGRHAGAPSVCEKSSPLNRSGAPRDLARP